MTEAGWTVCIECGMMCEAVEYHPYAACLMFKQCLNSETVRANLQAVRDDSYQQGRVAAAKECEKYARACVHERAVTLDGFTGSSAMAGVIRGKQSEAERIAEWCHKLAQQAQEGANNERT